MSSSIRATQSRQQALNELFIRASMRIRATQALRTLPVLVVSLIAIEFALHGRVASLQLHAWELAMAAVAFARALLCGMIRGSIETASLAKLRQYEIYLWVSATANAIVIGSSFWLVAANGDLTVRLVLTLISCFYAIGALINASSHFPSFAMVTAVHLGQGTLFWLGVGSNSPPLLAVAFPYLAVALLMIGFGRDYSRQFFESLRIRTENAELLAQAEADKKIVESALAEARLASESKSRFLAAASHDLRQPLHALTMFLGTLTFHVTTDDARRLLGRIKDTAGMLEEQFNSLLDLSRFDAGAVEIDNKLFRLDTVVEKLVEELRPEAEAKALDIRAVVCPATVRSDPLLIGRLLRNLIGNAVKYTASGSVLIRIARTPADFLVEVSDTGPGIAEDQQARIFEEYVQLANPARQRRHGVGLGLAIAKRIDSLLKLGLIVRSTLNVGSQFSFHVTTAGAGEELGSGLAEHFDVTGFRTSAKIWVLDDDPIVLDGLQEQLTAWGASVRTYSQPSELLSQLRAGTSLPRWILTDDMLGSALTGLETAQLLSSEFGFGNVCLITGNTEPKRLAELRSSGFPVIVKPAKPEALIAVLNG
ncbi:MAG: hybrid sensor histidine kinase/response regulator [Steroidobacteraceae bacterium]